MKDPVGPHSTPPFAGRRRRIAPQAARRRDVVESCLLGPREQPPTRIRFAAVGVSRLLVEVPPQVQRRKLRKPDEPRVVRISRRDNSAGHAHSPHLPQRLRGIGDVLQHLVSMDDVERVIRKVEPMHVGGGERDVGQVAPLGLSVGQVEDVGELVDGRDRSGRDTFGEVRGDCSGAATDVQQG
jgi:hypothetical protein